MKMTTTLAHALDCRAVASVPVDLCTCFPRCIVLGGFRCDRCYRLRPDSASQVGVPEGWCDVCWAIAQQLPRCSKHRDASFR